MLIFNVTYFILVNLSHLKHHLTLSLIFSLGSIQTTELSPGYNGDE